MECEVNSITCPGISQRGHDNFRDLNGNVGGIPNVLSEDLISFLLLSEGGSCTAYCIVSYVI